ncbi:hypothetical protein GCM10026986_25620 [Nitrincola alkalisediminis]
MIPGPSACHLFILVPWAWLKQSQAQTGTKDAKTGCNARNRVQSTLQRKPTMVVVNAQMKAKILDDFAFLEVFTHKKNASKKSNIDTIKGKGIAIIQYPSVYVSELREKRSVQQ